MQLNSFNEVHFGDDPKKCYERLLRGFQNILKAFQWKCFSSLEKTIRFLENMNIYLYIIQLKWSFTSGML